MRQRLLAVTLLLLLASQVVAQAPIYEEHELTGTFSLPAPQKGAVAHYSLSEGVDIGDGFNEKTAPVDFLSLAWEGPQVWPHTDGAAATVQSLRVEGQINRSYAYQMEQGNPELQATLTKSGYVASGSYVSHGHRYWLGAWQDHCFADLNKNGQTWDLANAAIVLDDCVLEGYKFEGEYRPIVRAKLGDEQTVVWYKPHAGLGEGATWMWLSESYPFPVAVIVQDPQHPRQFSVLRLNEYAAGDGEIVYGDKIEEKWPEFDTISSDRFGPDDRNLTTYSHRAAFEALHDHEDSAELRQWLEEFPDVYLSSASLSLTDAGGEKTISHFFGFESSARYGSASIDYEVPANVTEVDPQELIFETLFSTFAPAQSSVWFAAGEYDEPRAALTADQWGIDAPNPVAIATAARQVFDEEPTGWEWRRYECQGCENDMRLHASSGRITYFQNWTGDESTSDFNYVNNQVALTNGEVTSAWFYAEDNTPIVSAPASTVPSATGLLGILQDLGVLDAEALESRLASPIIGDDKEEFRAPMETPAPAPDATVITQQKSTNSDGIIGIVIAGSLGTSIAAWLVWKFVLGGALFSRVSKEKVLDNPKRQALFQLIEEQPGLHFSALARKMNVAPGHLRHHVDKLIDTNMVVELRGPGSTVFFVKGKLDAAVQQGASHVVTAARRKVLEEIVRANGTSQKTIAKRLTISPGTMGHHVKALAEQGLIDKGYGKVTATELGRQVATSVVAS